MRDFEWGAAAATGRTTDSVALTLDGAVITHGIAMRWMPPEQVAAIRAARDGRARAVELTPRPRSAATPPLHS